MVLPVLPAADIRGAVAAGDWTRASALVAGHDAQVRAAFVDPPPAESLAAWRDLLVEQQQLMLELQRQRDAAGEALARLQRERRAAHLYLSQSQRPDEE
ncbi:MAG: hypothetical protein HOQ02_06850 [Lysobacter sp.]|nr:hypothetical protein [Lysobacter sp.]